MERRRSDLGLEPMTYGIAGYVICRKDDREVEREIERITNVKDSAGYFGFKDFTTQSKLEQARLEFESVKVKCGITGLSGSGKSSLINAIAGERIARVNVVEQTNEPLEYTHGGVTFVDLPGCGTANWPCESYVSRLDLSSYDCFILVTAQRWRCRQTVNLVESTCELRRTFEQS